METKLVKKGLQSIYGGLQMLSESKTESLSAIAEISLILSNNEIRDRYQLENNINEFLGSILFLVKDLNINSVKIITEYINSIEYQTSFNVQGIDYKTKYEETLEKLNSANEELIKLKIKNFNEIKFPEIMSFMNHIFGDKLEIGKDYLQILLQNPNQKLPILCLLSEQNNTGKSTFCKLLKAIYKDSFIMVENDDIENNYNNKWSDKTIICCEESFKNKNKVKEYLKKLSESDKIVLNQKFSKAREISFNGKFIITSNNVEFLPIKIEDNMFWKIKLVNKPYSTGFSFDKMINEIPHFIEYLNNRKIHSANESRLWFNLELLK